MLEVRRLSKFYGALLAVSDVSFAAARAGRSAVAFTSPSPVGQLRWMWAVYVLGFANYTFASIRLELALLQHPATFAVAISGLAVLVLLMRRRHQRSLRGQPLVSEVASPEASLLKLAFVSLPERERRRPRSVAGGSCLVAWRRPAASRSF